MISGIKIGKISFLLFFVSWAGLSSGQSFKGEKVQNAPVPSVEKVTKTREEWKQELSAETYYIMREAGTEKAFTGKYWNFKEKGVYKCASCGLLLFTSDAKFDSSCGWPSFYEAVKEGNVLERKDFSLGMKRIEVVCAGCEGHLGHVFDDGPVPTGLRYCINSPALIFEEKK